MSDSYTNLLYHIIFSTKERLPLVTLDYQPRLYDYIGGTIRGRGGISLELNGTEDHVHLLAKLLPQQSTLFVRKLPPVPTGFGRMPRDHPGVPLRFTPGFTLPPASAG